METIYLVNFANLNTGEIKQVEMCEKLLSVAKKQKHIRVLNVQFSKKRLLHDLFDIMVTKINEEGV